MGQRICQQLELHARYAIVGHLASGRRVLDIGCGDGVALAQLLAGGAEKVVLASATAMGALAAADAEARGRAEAVADPTLPLSFADHAFDLIVCHDLVDRLAQSDDWIPELRRVLVADGYLLLAVANPAGRFLSELAGTRCTTALDYEATTEKLADVFGSVTVLGQTPMVASLFFDFDDASEEPGLSLDPALLPEDDDDQPGWYLLLCGPEPLHRDELAIVQVPFGQIVQGIEEQAPKAAMDPSALTAAPADAAAAAELAESRGQIAALQSRANELERALQAAEANREGRDGACCHLQGHSQAALVAVEDELRQSRAQLESLRAGHLTALRDAEGETHEAMRKIEEEATAQLEQERTEQAERLRQAEVHVQEAAARCAVAERRVRDTEQSLTAQLETERDARNAAEAALQQAQAAAGAEHQRAEEALARLQGAQAPGAPTLEELEKKDVRLSELEEQLHRQHVDRQSLEEQVRDLLDEVVKLRSATAEPNRGGQDVDALRREVTEEQARFARLVSEFAQVKEHLAGVEAERQSLAAEAQRLTDALHEQRIAAARVTQDNAGHPQRGPQPAEQEPAAPAASAPAAEIPVAVPVTRDAVGNQIDSTLTELEDLIEGSVKSPPD
jgi:SAM-dependent methyltransferase